MRILIVEDSESLRRSLRHGLERSGFAVDSVGDGAEAAGYMRSGVYDVIVLDLMLPGRDGLSLLREMRTAGIDTQVLILSARDQVQDRILGLELGADDYLVKPFAFDELRARIRALVRRNAEDRRTVITVHGVTIDTSSRQVHYNSSHVPLSPKEYGALEALCRHPGQVLSRRQLIEKTTDFDHEITENAIDVMVSGLRRKLRDAGAGNVVRTKRGFGYFVEGETG